jgi:hypothetical protein
MRPVNTSLHGVAGPALISVGAPVAALGAAAASLAGPGPFAVAVLTLQGLLVAGWCHAGLPVVRRGAEIAVGAGAAADTLLLARVAAPALQLPAPLAGPSVSPLLAVLPAAVAVALAAPLRPGRLIAPVANDRDTAALAGTAAVAGTVTVAMLAVLMSTLIAERTTSQGRLVTVAVLLATGMASVQPKRLGVAAAVTALTAAGGAAVLIGWLAPGLGMATALMLCFSAGGLTLVAYQVVSFVTAEELLGSPAQSARHGRAARRAAARATRRHDEAVLLLRATLPLALTAPAAYLLSRLLVG